MEAATPAKVVKPSTPAIKAMIPKMIAHLIMVKTSGSWRGKTIGNRPDLGLGDPRKTEQPN